MATLCVLSAAAHASAYTGRVLTHGFPLPGATVTLTQGAQRFSVAADANGQFRFPDIPDGTWTLHVEMTGFVAVALEVKVPAQGSTPQVALEMLPQKQMLALAVPGSAPPISPLSQAAEESKRAATGPLPKSPPLPSPPSRADELASMNEGFLINGSVNNARTSQYSLDQAFGNQHRGTKSLYTGGLAILFGNAVFDARPFSLSGVPQPKANYNRLSEVLTFGGPLNIPHLLGGRMFRGPNLALVYQRTRNREASIETGLVPTAAQRNASDAVAANLLALYPLPNIQAGNNYNYQVQVLNNTHVDAVQLRADRNLGQRDTLQGAFSLQNTRQDVTNLFGFRDATGILGNKANLNWQHRLRGGLYLNLGYSFSRLRTNVAPFFQNRIDVAGEAGVGAILNDSFNWGPPTLIFSSGLSSLSDAQAAFNRNRSDGIAASVDWYRGRHNISLGEDFRRQEYNYFSQSNPRGTFTFTGEALGSDLADFLAGVPDTVALNYGNADKYLRENASDLFVNDNWRVRPEFTVTAGIRWEYSAPMTELKQRLANLDVAPDFSAASTVVASTPRGGTTGTAYPTSLLRPDYTHVEPRVGIAWRPISASSLVVRAGYGIYADTSVYQAMTLSLAEQSPFSTSVQVNNSDCPQSLRAGPRSCSVSTTNIFAVDPNFRIGYAQAWNLSAQRDLPAALVATLSYFGVKGTRGIQDFLPNTYPVGTTNSDPSAPVGFLYRSSNGNSSRHAGTVQVRRRLRDGLTATAEYTYSRSVDNDSILGGQGPALRMASGSMGSTEAAHTSTIAQNWLDLHAERGLSTFDQRHLLNATLQYTSGVGLHGGTLLGGWQGRAVKDWTVAMKASVGSGLPETPVYLAAVPGTGYTGSIRPALTGADPYLAPVGAFLNAGAFTAPSPGAWGNAGRNSLRGPGTYSFDTSLARTFRIENMLNLDIRADATNLANHVVYISYNNVVNPNLVSPLFGVPTAAQPMRSLQLTARLRF